MFIVDKDTRLISTSDVNDFVLGCEGDGGSEIKQFQLPRYADTGWDLSTGAIRISYTNANGELGSYTVPADGMVLTDDTITADWLIEESVCAQAGTVTFGICSILADESGNKTNSWAGADLTKGVVLEHTCNADYVPESALADATASAIAAVQAAGANYETKTAHAADITSLKEDLTELESEKIGYVEYLESDNYLHCYADSTKKTEICKAYINGGGSTGGITEARCRAIIAEYGYITADALADYAKTSDLPSKTSDLKNDSGFITSSYHDSTKQDTITDLATIRSGASAGATAYQKPSTGIPASDLASGVIPTVTNDFTDTYKTEVETMWSDWQAMDSALTALEGVI